MIALAVLMWAGCRWRTRVYRSEQPIVAVCHAEPRRRGAKVEEIGKREPIWHTLWNIRVAQHAKTENSSLNVVERRRSSVRGGEEKSNKEERRAAGRGKGVGASGRAES